MPPFLSMRAQAFRCVSKPRREGNVTVYKLNQKPSHLQLIGDFVNVLKRWTARLRCYRAVARRMS
jgi:hypothetical protein